MCGRGKRESDSTSRKWAAASRERGLPRNVGPWRDSEGRSDLQRKKEVRSLSGGHRKSQKKGNNFGCKACWKTNLGKRLGKDRSRKKLVWWQSISRGSLPGRGFLLQSVERKSSDEKSVQMQENKLWGKQ